MVVIKKSHRRTMARMFKISTEQPNRIGSRWPLNRANLLLPAPLHIARRKTSLTRTPWTDALSCTRRKAKGRHQRKQLFVVHQRKKRKPERKRQRQRERQRKAWKGHGESQRQKAKGKRHSRPRTLARRHLSLLQTAGTLQGRLPQICSSFFKNQLWPYAGQAVQREGLCLRSSGRLCGFRSLLELLMSGMRLGNVRTSSVGSLSFPRSLEVFCRRWHVGHGLQCKVE